MGLRHTWNHARSIMRTPCTASGDVGLYLEVTARALSPVLWDFLSFGCREPLKFAAGRGQFADWFGRDNVRGFPHPHRRPKIGGGRGIPPSVNAGVNLFWAMDALFERALLYWFVAELAQEFFINWSTLMYAELGCDQQRAGGCVFGITDQIVGPQRGDMLLQGSPDCHGVLSDTRAIYIPAGLQASIGYSFNAVPWAPAPIPNPTVNSFLYDSDSGKAWAGSQWTGGGNTGNGLAAHAHGISGGLGAYRRIAISVGTDGGLAWCTNGKLHVSLQGHAVPLVPLSDCFKNDKKPLRI